MSKDKTYSITCKCPMCKKIYKRRETFQYAGTFHKYCEECKGKTKHFHVKPTSSSSGYLDGD